MRLNKAPIVEAWIEFHFEHGEDRREWSLEAASEFFDRLEGYANLETLQSHQIRIEKVDRLRKPRIVEFGSSLDGVRSSNANKSKYVQLTPTSLVCNFIRTNDKGYDGFSASKVDALATLRIYVEMFRPLRLLEFALQYVDLIEIPWLATEDIELEEYFSLGIRLPKTGFGGISDFLVQATTHPPNSEDILEVRLQDERDPLGETSRFRMDWRLRGRHRLSLVPEEVGSRLEEGHALLLDCFRNSFTEKTWKLFDPSPEAS